MGGALGAVVLGAHHAVGAEPVEDRLVAVGLGLGVDLRGLQGLRVHRGEHAGLEVRGGDDDGVHAADREFAQRVEVGDVGDGGAGELVGQAVDDRFVAVDAEHVVALAGELLGEVRAEAAEAEHGDLHGPPLPQPIRTSPAGRR